MDLKQWSIVYTELHISIYLLFSKWRTKKKILFSTGKKKLVKNMGSNQDPVMEAHTNQQVIHFPMW